MRTLKNLILALFVFAARLALSQDLIINVTTVNVTPSGFSVVAQLSPNGLASNATITVFSDSAGTQSLAGQVGLQYYPLNTGDPTKTTPYTQLLSKAALMQDSMGLGAFYAKVLYCAPNTTYYYQISATDTNGQTVLYPAAAPLPSVTTAVENAFVVQSKQLLVTLNDSDPPGSIIMVSNLNSPSVLAAVVGDGAGTNQAFFDLNDLIAASGGTNYLPTGSQIFTATLLGLSTGLSQNYNLIIDTNFAVGGGSDVSIGVLPVTVGMGQAVALAGTSGSIPIYVTSQSALVNLSFTLPVQTNLFSALSVQATTPLLSSATLKNLSSNSIQLGFAATAGANLEGSEQIAQLNFTTWSNDPSAFVQFWPQSPQGTNSDLTTASISTQPGRLVLIGPQPLLDTQLQGTTRNLVLYGIPGNSYQIQTASSILRPGVWSNFMRVPMTNMMEVVPNLDPTPAAVFFRAYQLNADPPILQNAGTANSRSLLAFGVAGSNYVLQISSNLSATVAWYPLLNYTLTNSFQYFTNLSGSNSSIFYRIKKQ